MQPLPHPTPAPTYVEMKCPLTTIEAAMVVAGVPLHTPSTLVSKMRNVKRLQSDIQKACILYDDQSHPSWYRMEHGIPSSWDGGKRVIEKFQVEQWRKRKYTASRRPRYKELEEALNG